MCTRTSQVRYGTNGHAAPIRWPKLLIEEELFRGPTKNMKEDAALDALVKGQSTSKSKLASPSTCAACLHVCTVSGVALHQNGI